MKATFKPAKKGAQIALLRPCRRDTVPAIKLLFERKSCPVCGTEKLAPIKNWHGTVDVTLGYSCAQGHIFIVRKARCSFPGFDGWPAIRIGFS